MKLLDNSTGIRIAATTEFVILARSNRNDRSNGILATMIAQPHRMPGNRALVGSESCDEIRLVPDNIQQSLRQTVHRRGNRLQKFALLVRMRMKTGEIILRRTTRLALPHLRYRCGNTLQITGDR